jgi:hypothetical protein
VIRKRRKTRRRPQTRRLEGVFHRDRKAVQRTEDFASSQSLVGGIGPGTGTIRVERDDGIELGIALGDPHQEALEKLSARDLATAERA